MFGYATFALVLAATGMSDASSSITSSQYYNIQHNPNCPASSTLDSMFGLKDVNPAAINGTSQFCCGFQEQVVSDIVVEDKTELNEYSVIYGQFLWSHDTALTPTTDEKLVLTCPSVHHPIKMSTLKRNNQGAIVNAVTACIDASGVYGSTAENAKALTGSAYPKLAMSGKNPCSTNTCKVEMANPRKSEKLFSYGDARGNENPVLSAIHFMWVKRHNMFVDQYKKAYSTLTNDQLYEKARARIIAEQQVTAKEYVASLTGSAPEYDPSKERTGETVKVYAEFSHCINRYQHSQLRNDMTLQSPGVSQTLNLMKVSFNPTWVYDFGTSPIINGTLTRKSAMVGMNFPPDLVGSFGRGFNPSLAVVDCQRGREIGLKGYAQVQREMFKRPIYSMADISSDPKVQQKLTAIYGNNVEEVDLFVGGLAEDHVKGSAVGSTFKAIFFKQFEDMMYKDTQYFERKGVPRPLDDAEMEQIKKLTMADILRESSELDCIPQDAFKVIGPSNPVRCRSSTFRTSTVTKTTGSGFKFSFTSHKHGTNAQKGAWSHMYGTTGKHGANTKTKSTHKIAGKTANGKSSIKSNKSGSMRGTTEYLASSVLLLGTLLLFFII